MCFLFLHCIHAVPNGGGWTILVYTKGIILQKHTYFRTLVLGHAVRMGQLLFREAHMSGSDPRVSWEHLREGSERSEWMSWMSSYYESKEISTMIYLIACMQVFKIHQTATMCHFHWLYQIKYWWLNITHIKKKFPINLFFIFLQLQSGSHVKAEKVLIHWFSTISPSSAQWFLFHALSEYRVSCWGQKPTVLVCSKNIFRGFSCRL